MVDLEPLDDYPSGPHDTSLLWRYHVHVARKASDGEVFLNVKLTLIFVKMMFIFVKLMFINVTLINCRTALFVKP